MWKRSVPAARRGRRTRSVASRASQNMKESWTSSCRTWKSPDTPALAGKPCGERAKLTTKRFEREMIQGFLHEPAEPNGSALGLTHGAGGNCEQPMLVAVADAFAEAGCLVLRYDLPFRQERK